MGNGICYGGLCLENSICPETSSHFLSPLGHPFKPWETSKSNDLILQSNSLFPLILLALPWETSPFPPECFPKESALFPSKQVGPDRGIIMKYAAKRVSSGRRTGCYSAQRICFIIIYGSHICEAVLILSPWGGGQNI